MVKSVDQHIGEEIFVVSGSQDDGLSDLFFAETWFELVDHLKTLTPAEDAETRVFHGVLTTAEILPSSFRGKSAFVICIDPVNPEKGYIEESGSISPEGIASEIQDVLRLGGLISNTKLEIDDLFILYGYQLTTCLSINEEDVDEETICTCREMAEEVDTVRLSIENGL